MTTISRQAIWPMIEHCRLPWKARCKKFANICCAFLRHSGYSLAETWSENELQGWPFYGFGLSAVFLWATDIFQSGYIFEQKGIPISPLSWFLAGSMLWWSRWFSDALLTTDPFQRSVGGSAAMRCCTKDGNLSIPDESEQSSIEIDR